MAEQHLIFAEAALLCRLADIIFNYTRRKFYLISLSYRAVHKCVWWFRTSAPKPGLKRISSGSGGHIHAIMRRHMRIQAGLRGIALPPLPRSGCRQAGLPLFSL